MTLEEAFSHAKTVPSVGDYEFARLIGGSGLTHMLIVTQVTTGTDGVPLVDFSSRCGQEMGQPPSAYEVAARGESCNCLRCIQ